MARGRKVCFTLNNYTEEEVSSIRNLQNELQFLIFQRETGSNGTKHIQGFAYASFARSLIAWKRSIGQRAHIEFAKGSVQQNVDYCSKEDTRDPDTECERFGREPDVQGARNDLGEVAKRVRDGASLEQLAVEFPADFLRYPNGIARMASMFSKPRKWKTEIFWYHGPTGSGKSRFASEEAPNAYWKMGSSKWWDGYDQHEDVIIDDYRRDLCTFAELLRLFDRYPMRVEFKGGTCSFVAKRIFVTAPRCPRLTWEGRVEEDLRQLERRIEHVRRFDGQPLEVAEDGGGVVEGIHFGESRADRELRVGRESGGV